MTKRLYVIDVDGTVADCEHRAHHINGSGPRDWDSFFDEDAMAKDAVIESARAHFRVGRFVHGPHIFLTARIASRRFVTKAWLCAHGFATNTTRVLCKPDYLRLQRSRVFKPDVLASLKRFEFPDHELVMIEDYGEVRRSVADAGFEVLHAPDCWEDWPHGG